MDSFLLLLLFCMRGVIEVALDAAVRCVCRRRASAVAVGIITVLRRRFAASDDDGDDGSNELVENTVVPNTIDCFRFDEDEDEAGGCDCAFKPGSRIAVVDVPRRFSAFAVHFLCS